MKKVLSILISVLMLASFASIAFAADGAITVRFSAYDGTMIVPYVELEVTDGLAEQYGYAMPAEDHNDAAINGPTLMDALVAAHIYKYGADFTAETAANYLDVDTLAFGKEALAETSFTYTVNGKVPYDDVISQYEYPPNSGNIYQYMTVYGINEARIADGDDIAVYFYQDADHQTDNIAWFECDTASGSEVTAGSEVVLTLKGVESLAFSSPDWADRVAPLAGVAVYARKGDGSFVKGGVTDSDGKIVLTANEAGDYTYAAYGADNDGVFAAPAFYLLTVKEKPADDPGDADGGKLSLWQRIVAFFKKIADFFKNLFSFGR